MGQSYEERSCSLSSLEVELSELESYRPAAAVATASALRWVSYDAALAVVRGLLGASHEDLRLRVHLLSRSLSTTFFTGGASAATSFAAGVRFPKEGLFVCADLPPLRQALQAAQRAMMQVGAKNTSHDSCDWYYDTVGELMRLLIADVGGDRLAVVFNQVAFEATFKLKWDWEVC